MCGIGGISASNPHFTEEQAEMCVRLLASLTRRGRHAWGYFDGSRVYKQPGDFEESDEIDSLAEVLMSSGTNIFLCHTRHATQGSPEINKNNHPFQLDPFVFVHNGALTATDEFDNEWGIETDSFWMLYWISYEWNEMKRRKKKKDIVKAIDLGVDHVEGVYACWLYNRNDRGTYLFRMGNPIVEMDFYEDDDMLMFGSDGQSIVDGLGGGFLESRGLMERVVVKSLKPGMVYQMKDGKIWRMGPFTPGILSPSDLRWYMKTFAHLMKYHR